MKQNCLSYKMFLLLTVLFLTIIAGYTNDSTKNCNCLSNFNWMTETFSKNDAGFHSVIDKKGLQVFNDFNNALKSRAANGTSLLECRDILSLWLQFFRDGHISIQLLKSCDIQINASEDDIIRTVFKQARRVPITETGIKIRLAEKNKTDPIEGIWQSNGYKMGVIENEFKQGEFVAFVLEADSVYWFPGQIKARFTKSSTGNFYTTEFARRDHSIRNDRVEMVNKSKSMFTVYNNGSFWMKVFPQSTFTEDEKSGYDFYNKRELQLKKLSNQTVYLRIPSFNASYKKGIDSLLQANDQLIRTTPNLIIDIRNGTGGSDLAYSNIIPYLYTQPIRKVGVQLLGTELNAQSRDNTANEYKKLGLAQTASNLSRQAELMRKNRGKFFNPNDFVVRETVKDTILPYPLKVGIIANRGNGSTDEQFLLDAKQSFKVKIFGRPTQGVLDISNMSFVNSPDGIFQLGYCMSKSYRLPYFGIDGIGIQPDYYIDDEISLLGWINYVQNVLEKQ